MILVDVKLVLISTLGGNTGKIEVHQPIGSVLDIYIVYNSYQLKVSHVFLMAYYDQQLISAARSVIDRK